LFAILRGKKEEKAVAAVIFIGWITEPFFHDRHHMTAPEYGVVLYDVFALIAFIYISVRSRKIWTIFLSASQLNGVITHFVVATHLRIPLYGFVGLNWIWTGYGLLLALLIGTIQSIRARMRFAKEEGSVAG
jgi:hypothetical protein